MSGVPVGGQSATSFVNHAARRMFLLLAPEPGDNHVDLVELEHDAGRFLFLGAVDLDVAASVRP
jgi:hypothetical protein